jgi:hypothetical protein
VSQFRADADTLPDFTLNLSKLPYLNLTETSLVPNLPLECGPLPDS